MKKNYILNCLLLSALVTTILEAQPCSGTPGNNTIIPSSYTVCTGDSVLLTLAVTYTNSGILYQWQSSTVSPVGPFSSIPGATLSSYTSGNLSNNTYYNVVITCTNSGLSNSAAHTVSVVTCPPPCVANANFTLSPTSTPQLWNAFPATTTGISAAQWQWGDGTSSNTLFTSHQYTSAGMYTICLSITVTCGSSDMACPSYSIFRSSSDMIQVNVIAPGTVGLADTAPLSSDIVVYPNPNNGQFSIQLSGSKAVTGFEITNVLGSKVFESKENITNPVTREFDLSHLENGIYFLKVTRGTRSEIIRISIRQ